jgi:amino acid transporter
MNTASPAAVKAVAPSRPGLGTFAGVFTPSILTILGIVLFLRLDFVVGAAGLARALAIIGLANAISVVTALSVAAIATNLRVKAGGDYYLISRTLGFGFGGAIGVVLFLAQAVSIGFYCIGFAEAILPLLASHGVAASAWTLRGVAAVAVIALSALAWLGADLATRFQYVVMAMLAAALGSFVAGAAGAWDGALLRANWAPPDGVGGALPFWAGFAIFFPAVTGFTQGVSMSGDLAQPRRSIPLGVLSAVGVSIVVYFGCAVLFAAAAPNAVLHGDPAAMRSVAKYAVLIDLGIMAATLSSALASFLGAPRILQSLARDEVFPWLAWFAVGSGPSANPRRAVLPTLFVALAVIALGNLNLVASVVSMFFLVSYGLMNYATYFEARAGSPSFRPTFRFYDQRIGLLGALGCLAAMLAIDIAAGVIAALIVYAIYHYLRYQAMPVTWTDGRRAYHLQVARDHLLAAAKEAEHARAWRPQLLVFSDSSARRARLLHFARWIEGGAGMTTVVRMIESSARDALERRKKAAAELAAEIKAQGSTAFPLVVVGPDREQMVASIVQAAGVGPLQANTVVANWPDPEAAFFAPLGVGGFGKSLALAFRVGANLLLLDADAREWDTLDRIEASERIIDVWWRDTRTGELMLLLAYLMTRSDAWKSARIRLLAEPGEGEPREARKQVLVKQLEEIRIDAEIVIVDDHERETVVAESQGSSMVFMPFRIHGGRFYSPFGWEVGAALTQLPIVALVLAAQDIDLGADPDEGTAPAEPTPAAGSGAQSSA